MLDLLESGESALLCVSNDDNDDAEDGDSIRSSCRLTSKKASRGGKKTWCLKWEVYVHLTHGHPVSFALIVFVFGDPLSPSFVSRSAEFEAG